MEAINNIQEKIGRIKLRRLQKRLSRNVKAFNIENATSIGVLYNATNRSEAELVKKFIQFLKEERKDVLSLGFIDSKDASDMVKPHLNYSFFDKKSLSKSLIPASSDVESFINKPFSILIDLNLNQCFPLEYISTLSCAKFKVGATGSYRNDNCDLTIDISKNNQINYFIIQVKHYLQMIKN